MLCRPMTAHFARRSGVEFLWIRSLRKRSQRDRTTWEKTKKLSEEWLPKPRILHPWPSPALRRQTPKVGAVCGNPAGTVLCGGRAVMCVPPLAIPHSLDEMQREELRRFLSELAGGATLVLLSSRGEETWLAPGSFSDNVYQLGGLDPEAASNLADAVLQRARTQARRQETAFKDLMILLAGYPLALQVVLPHLAAKTSAEVLNELRRGRANIDADPGAIQCWPTRAA